jgi:hypothetical protein
MYYTKVINIGDFCVLLKIHFVLNKIHFVLNKIHFTSIALYGIL